MGRQKIGCKTTGKWVECPRRSVFFGGRRMGCVSRVPRGDHPDANSASTPARRSAAAGPSSSIVYPGNVARSAGATKEVGMVLRCVSKRRAVQSVCTEALERRTLLSLSLLSTSPGGEFPTEVGPKLVYF